MIQIPRWESGLLKSPFDTQFLGLFFTSPFKTLPWGTSLDVELNLDAIHFMFKTEDLTQKLEMSALSVLDLKSLH